MPLNDGGPAFPSEQGHIPDGTWNQTYNPGMSLRDWFAGNAPCSPEWYWTNKGYTPWSNANLEAEWRYIWADSMLKARRDVSCSP